MSQLSVQVQINAPTDKIWKVLVDLTRLPEWVPDDANLNTVLPDSGNTSGPKYYDVDPFQNVEEEATDWEEGYRYAYEVRNIGPIKSVSNWFSLAPSGEETVLTQTLNLQMKFGAVGALMGALVFRPQFRKQMEQSLTALKEYIEGGNMPANDEADLALVA